MLVSIMNQLEMKPLQIHFPRINLVLHRMVTQYCISSVCVHVGGSALGVSAILPAPLWIPHPKLGRTLLPSAPSLTVICSGTLYMFTSMC